ncbi:MAG: acyltransferase, partial [Oleibacter sp.]|nr:acyltransferase [Thalassolituus sp.]
AFAMSAMGDQFRSILDVTIHYPEGSPTFWDFLQGKMRRCDVVIEEKTIPVELLNGDYEKDDAYRLQFQQWVQLLWEQKDEQLKTMAQKG